MKNGFSRGHAQTGRTHGGRCSQTRDAYFPMCKLQGEKYASEEGVFAPLAFSHNIVHDDKE
jgi:hypothetical protein